MEPANSFSNSLFHGKSKEKWGGGGGGGLQPKNLDNMRSNSDFISQWLLSTSNIYHLSSVVFWNELNTVCKILKIFERVSPSILNATFFRQIVSQKLRHKNLGFSEWSRRSALKHL